MTDLKKEYTDTKAIKHKVEHVIMPDDEDKGGKERVIEELLNVLTRSKKHISA